MKFKVDFSLPKLVRFRVGIQLGADVGARVDVRLRLRGRDPLRWKAALGPSKTRAELPEVTVVPGGELPRA
jgi:hypothetical protein